MKRIWILALLGALLLTGCGRAAEDPHPDWDGSWTRIGEHIGVEPLEGFELNEYNDAMSIYGIFYSTWTSGEARETTNAEGESASVYDAQIYLLLEECGSTEDAENDIGAWTAREKQSYETGEAQEIDVAGQNFRLLPLLSGSADNPYIRGAAAFAARGELAVSVEFLCSEDFVGDPQVLLEQFLSGFHYAEE